MCVCVCVCVCVREREREREEEEEEEEEEAVRTPLSSFSVQIKHNSCKPRSLHVQRQCEHHHHTVLIESLVTDCQISLIEKEYNFIDYA